LTYESFSGYPDFPMPQLLHTSRGDRRVVVSCLVSDLRFEWGLEPLRGDGTRIRVRVEIPPDEAWRLDTQRDLISRSARRLAELAGGHGPRRSSPPAHTG
jgi:hypothetical protein